MRVRSLCHFLIIGLVLSACASTDSTLEKVAYDLARGGEGRGASASAKLQPFVDDIENLDLELALRVAQLYVGAKMAEAGFDGIEVIANLVYKEGENTVSSLANIVAPDLSLAEIRGLLRETDSMIQALSNRADVQSMNSSSLSACATRVCEKLREVRLTYGFRWLADAIAISTKETTFFDGSADFDRDQCITALEDNPNSLPVTLLQARLQFNAAALNDLDAEVLGDPTDVSSGIATGDAIDTGLDRSELTNASSINDLVAFVDDYQNVGQGDLIVDPDFNGVLGDESDGRTATAKVGDLCDYLESQAD